MNFSEYKYLIIKYHILHLKTYPLHILRRHVIFYLNVKL